MPALEKVGKKIAAGQKMNFDEADVHKWSDLLESIPRPPKTHLGLTVRQWTVLAIGLGGAAAMGVCALSVAEFR